MTSRRILVIGLDGVDLALAERFQAEGILPNFGRFQEQAARFKLDHGRDKYSGLAWEHLSSGIAPSDGGRWSAVDFDRKTHSVRQNVTRVQPFVSDLSARTVVFDFPYFDLSLAQDARGITNWGAHDPGVASASCPSTLQAEFDARFGPYPAADWLYGFCWPSPDQSKAAGDALVRATNVRSQAAMWLLSERLPDWDLGVVVVGEGHCAIEPLWHGVDETHPLHAIESAPEAATALRNVYRAMDNLIGDLWQKFHDATVLLVAMHGMGPNDSDVPAMVLLPELLYRFNFLSPHMRPIQFPGFLPDGTPLLAQDADWHNVLLDAVPEHHFSRLPDAVPNGMRRWIERAGFNLDRLDPSAELNWMPATRYSHFWPRMKAFALPSFYDGRIRLNVMGREAKGLIERSQYEAACQQITELVSDCRNPQTGGPVVREIYAPKKNPNEVGPSEADIYVIWEGAPLGFTAPGLGPQLATIGPVPYRRTGGHTGPHGFLSIVGDDLPSGDYGIASSFDVVPTVISLLGEKKKSEISGKSLVPFLETTAAQKASSTSFPEQ